jgi:hypothetical protein
MSITSSSAQGGANQYDLAYQVCPILLQGGAYTGVQGGLYPIINIYNGSTSDTDGLPRFLPLPGSTLVSQTIGMYPFANQAVAANATIQQPLTLSLVMIAPVNQPGGYLSKHNMLTGLATSLQNHNALGGTYVIATPAYVYYNMLMTSMTDISPEGEDKQVQIEWQLDFIQPLISQQQATATTGTLMTKITNGNKVSGTQSWSGNQAASPATLTGVTGALAAFGGSATPP